MSPTFQTPHILTLLTTLALIAPNAGHASRAPSQLPEHRQQDGQQQASPQQPGRAPAPARADAPLEGGQQTTRLTEALFSIDVPNGWRVMTPDEMFELREQLPFVMRAAQPQWQYSIGDIDRWLREGFDGRALVVHVQAGEIPIQPESIERIREAWSKSDDSTGGRREVLDAEVTTIGRDAHPAIRCRVRTAAWGGMPPIEALEFYVPTNGHMLILGFRSWQDDIPNVRAAYEAVVASATFPRPPREPERVSDRLWQAALIGALVGLLLIALRKSIRR